MKKQIIKMPQDTDLNCLILGILSSEDEYKIIWEINRVLDINLSKNKDDYSLWNGKKGVDEVEIRLFTNRLNNNYLIPEHKNFDYFLIIFSEETAINNIAEYTLKIRRSELIQGIFPVPISTFKTNIDFLFC